MITVFKKGQFIFLCAIFVVVVGISIASAVSSPVNAVDIPSIAYSVVIDAGHGGVDPGGVGVTTKVRESDINLAIAKKLKSLLQSAGVTVVLTREDENGLYGIYTKNYKKVDLAKRKEIIVNTNPDAVVSIHMNRFTNRSLRGAQAFYNESSETGKFLASCVQIEFENKLPESTKGIAKGDYYMLKCSPAAAIIAECGFLSNSEDEKLLITNEYQDKVAYALFCGLVRYFSLAEMTSNMMRSDW